MVLYTLGVSQYNGTGDNCKWESSLDVIEDQSFQALHDHWC